MQRSGSTSATPISVTSGNGGNMKAKGLLKLATRSTTVVALAGVPTMAHHSASYFDMETQIVHENVTVVEFRVANPHGELIYIVTDDGGNEVEWNAELPSANFTRRAGIGGSTLSPGDRVTLIGWPGRPGRTRERLMRLMRAEFPNGDVAMFTAISATLIRAERE